MAGGLLRGSVVLVEGTAGTGKTTLGMEFIYRGAAEFNEPGLIVLFEVSPTSSSAMRRCSAGTCPSSSARAGSRSSSRRARCSSRGPAGR